VQALRRASHHHRHAWLVALLLSLLFAHSLGLLHRVQHADLAAPGAESALFGHHDSQECRLYDQLASGDALPLPVLPPALPSVGAQAFAEAPAAAWLAAAPAAYQARAPPRG
jgi:hypothetical protein